MDMLHDHTSNLTTERSQQQSQQNQSICFHLCEQSYTSAAWRLGLLQWVCRGVVHKHQSLSICFRISVKRHTYVHVVVRPGVGLSDALKLRPSGQQNTCRRLAPISPPQSSPSEKRSLNDVGGGDTAFYSALSCW